MKTTLVAGLMMLALGSTAAHATGGAILSAELTQDGQIEVETVTSYYCNKPEVSLVYKYSDRATFGPHYYELQVIGINRMRCRNSLGFFSTQIPAPALSAGSVLVIKGDQNSEVRIQL